MKNKKIIIICTIVAMLLIAAGIILLCHRNANDSASIKDDSAYDINDSDNIDDADEQQDNDADDSDADGSSNQKSSSKKTGSKKNNSKNNEKDENNQEIVPVGTIAEFPYTIPNSQLEILTVSSYSGIYLEDGSNSDISGVATTVVKNNGKTPVEFVNISMTDNGKKLEFEGTDIPAGATIVLQEKNKESVSKGELTDCSADIAYTDSMTKSSKQVKVTENDNNTISVKNTSKSTIPCVRVFYKYYYDEENSYVGGITYVAKLTDIKAGDELTVSPSNYASGYSKVVMVRTYDSAA